MSARTVLLHTELIAWCMTHARIPLALSMDFSIALGVHVCFAFCMAWLYSGACIRYEPFRIEATAMVIQAARQCVRRCSDVLFGTQDGQGCAQHKRAPATILTRA